MPTIITLVIVFLLILSVVLILTVKDITKQSDEVLRMWEKEKKHPWINGDCCRCAECTKQFHDELLGDLESTTQINHNLRNNR